jgi:ribosomal-protein-alanine N-acetyltransferase
MKIFIETKNLIIAEPTISDFDQFEKLMSDPEVMQFVGGIRSSELVRQKIDEAIMHFSKHGFSAGHVYEKPTGEFIGRAGIFYLEMNDQQPDIEIGYTLHKKYWGKGYASELAKGMIDWAARYSTIKKLVGVTFPENIASRKVLEKAGMKFIGISRAYNEEVAKYEIVLKK